MNAKDNLISLVMPIYRSKKLKQAILSLRFQTDKNIQLVISDDGNNYQEVTHLRNHYPNLIYKKNSQPLGEVDNTNQAVGLSSGEYVVLFHDDDLLNPDYISSVRKAIYENESDIDFIYTAREIIDENSKIVSNKLKLQSENYVLYSANNVLLHILSGNHLENYYVPLMTPGMVFKRQIYLEMGGFSKKIDTHCDSDFLLRYLLHSRKILLINQNLYSSRIWYGSSGRSKSSESGTVFFAQLGVLENFFRYCKKNRFNKFLDRQAKIYKYFCKQAVAINGPFIWIGLHHNSNLYLKSIVLTRTFAKLVRIDKTMIFNLRLYLLFLIALIIPREVFRFFQRKFISFLF